MSSLPQIEQDIRICEKCSLCLSRKHAVPGDGNYDASIMFIGEAPGRHEDELGKPFVGKAGKLLDFALSTIGLQRETVYITNVVKCRPPGNRNPTTDEITMCGPYLDAQIHLISPRVICPMGNFASKYILSSYGFLSRPISQIHGQLYKSTPAMLTILPLYHPAALLYTPTLKEIFFRDIQLLLPVLKSN
jgi:DNA polymerase